MSSRLACVARNPIYSRLAHPQCAGDFSNGLTLRLQSDALGGVTLGTRSAANPALRPRARQTGKRALREADSFLFGDHRQNRNHGLAKHAAGVQILLSETAIADAVPGEGLQIRERLEDALAAEAVQAPEQHQSKLPARGRPEQRLELLPLAVLAGGHVHVFPLDVPALRPGKDPELVELVLVVLLVGRDAAVNCDIHSN